MSDDITYRHCIAWLVTRTGCTHGTQDGDSVLFDARRGVALFVTAHGARKKQPVHVLLADIGHRYNLCRGCVRRAIEADVELNRIRYQCWEKENHSTPRPRREEVRR
jgi:hypothetical protein